MTRVHAACSELWETLSCNLGDVSGWKDERLISLFEVSKFEKNIFKIKEQKEISQLQTLSWSLPFIDLYFYEVH